MEPVIVLFTKDGSVKKVLRTTAEEYAEKKAYRIEWGRDHDGGTFHPADDKGWQNGVSFICSWIED